MSPQQNSPPKEKTENRLKLYEQDVIRLKYYLNLISEEIPRLNYTSIVELGNRIFYTLNSLNGKATDIDTQLILQNNLIPFSNNLRVSLAGTAPVRLGLDKFGVWTLQNKRDFLSDTVRTIYSALEHVQIIEKELTFYEVRMEFDLLQRYLRDNFERGMHCDMLIKQAETLSMKLLSSDKLKASPKISSAIYLFKNKLINALGSLRGETDEKKQNEYFNIAYTMYNRLQTYESLKDLQTTTITELEGVEPEVIAKKKPKTEKPKNEESQKQEKEEGENNV